MAFAADLTLDDADGTDIVYKLRSQDGSGSQRIDVATDLRNPGLLTIRHSSTGSGVDAIDRHLAQITRALTDTNGKQATLTVNFTLQVPRNTVITNQIVYDAVANLIDFLSDGGLTIALASTNAIQSLLRGES